MSKNEIAWIDRDKMPYTMDEIGGNYLLNILRFMCKGGGHDDFLTMDKVMRLFEEADKRGLKHYCVPVVAIHALRSKWYCEAEFHEDEW